MNLSRMRQEIPHGSSGWKKNGDPAEHAATGPRCRGTMAPVCPQIEAHGFEVPPHFGKQPSMTSRLNRNPRGTTSKCGWPLVSAAIMSLHNDKNT